MMVSIFKPLRQMGGGSAALPQSIPTPGLANGAGSNWDENVDSTGRAHAWTGLAEDKDRKGITGAQGGCTPSSPCPTGPNVKNSTTGTVAWTQEFLEPVYTWMNTVASTPLLSIASPATVQNRDIYRGQRIVHWSDGNRVRNPRQPPRALWMHRRTGRHLWHIAHRKLRRRLLGDRHQHILGLHCDEHMDADLRPLHLPLPWHRRRHQFHSHHLCLRLGYHYRYELHERNLCFRYPHWPLYSKHSKRIDLHWLDKRQLLSALLWHNQPLPVVLDHRQPQRSLLCRVHRRRRHSGDAGLVARLWIMALQLPVLDQHQHHWMHAVHLLCESQPADDE